MRSTQLQLITLAAIVSTLSACGVSQTVYQKELGGLRGQIGELDASRQKMHRDNLTLTEKQRALQSRNKGLSDELAVLKSQGQVLDENLRLALRQVEQLQQVSAQQAMVFDGLRAALDGLVKSGQLRVAIVRGQFTVIMADKILFDSGKKALKPEAAGTLKELATILGSLKGRRYQVVGHTDTDGPDDYNWRLSAGRAEAVSMFMLEQGMPPQMLSFAAAGEYQPAVPNDSPENKALNRRIDIVLIPNLEELLRPLEATEPAATTIPGGVAP